MRTPPSQKVCVLVISKTVFHARFCNNKKSPSTSAKAEIITYGKNFTRKWRTSSSLIKFARLTPRKRRQNARTARNQRRFCSQIVQFSRRRVKPCRGFISSKQFQWLRFKNITITGKVALATFFAQTLQQRGDDPRCTPSNFQWSARTFLRGLTEIMYAAYQLHVWLKTVKIVRVYLVQRSS